MKRRLLILIFFLLLTSITNAQLTVNYISATQFVQQWLGPNVSFTNAVFSGNDLTQIASFSGTTIPNIGIPSGVMLATGDAMIAGDTTSNFANGNSVGGTGDADLSGACNQQTHDLAAVEFDFWTPADSVEFTFMFASEEYNYWVNSKNDVCGARLYNAGGGYADVIYLPGTFLPVCVNNVNNGAVPNIGDVSTGPCTNCQYFFDNTYGSTFKYNGYTSQFTIKMAVTPCDTFHFWIGVADAQDFIYDSAILFPDASFKGVNTPEISAVGYPPNTDTVNVCAGTPVTLLTQGGTTYSWSSGQTTQQITVTTPGIYYLTSACGTLSNQIVVNASGGPSLLFSSPEDVCLGLCIDFVNQSVNATSYQWFFSGASPDTSTAENPSGICYTSSGQYDVMLIGSDGNCADTLFLPGYITVFQNTAQGIIQSGDTLISDTGFQTYQWYYNGNIITGATNFMYVALQSGDYQLFCTDTNGCSQEADINNVIAEVAAESLHNTVLYPNPAGDELIIELQNSFLLNEVNFYNLSGEMVMTVHPANQNHNFRFNIDLSSLASGMYWAEIITAEKIFRNRFVKK